MAKDIELEKSSPEGEDEQEAPKKAEKSEKSDKKDGKKGDAKDKKSPKGKKQKKGLVKYFKDARSEFKKVVWPTPKETTRNAVVVIVVCLLAGAFVFGIDTLFGLVNGLLFGGKNG